MSAGKDINAQAADVQASQALSVKAGNSINIEAGVATSNYDEAHQKTSKGFLSKSTTTTRDTRSTSTAIGSSFEGSTVAISAGKDIAIQGSNVVSDNDTILNAGGNVNIEAAQNTSSSSSYQQTTKSGLLSGGAALMGVGLINDEAISYGKQKQSLDQKDATTTAAASTVGSINGNVSITAGQQYKQVGSDVLTPTGDINITAKTVDITEARETNKQSTEQKFEQSGLTLAVTSTVLSTLENAQSQIKATTQTKDSRMKALGAVSAAANVKLAADALKAGQGDEHGMVKDETTYSSHILRSVLQSIDEVQALLAQGNTQIYRRLTEELSQWFPGHADYLDSALAHWMCKQRLGGKPVVVRRDLAALRARADQPLFQDT